jgi:hypothetical protein
MNSMKIDNKTTITFSRDDIINIVKIEVMKQGYSATDVAINIKKNRWTDGHGFGEIDHEELVLDSLEVTANKIRGL